ncbi:MAG: methyltransferase domain-containing protein [Isosphaeraceae bacterium]|nr:methyltransferase domain-containing protein [Isosphaeraceae bacterium]
MVRVRRRLPELMDDPNLDERSHRQALAGLRRVNSISRSDAILWNPVRRLAAAAGDQPLRLLDIACGGGDVTCRLAERARRAGFRLQIDGCDRSDVALGTARELAAERRLQGVEFFRLDVLQDVLPADYDIVMCSLFLHHLDADDVVRLLRNMAQAARRAVLANDLRRTAWGYTIAWVGCRMLSRSPVVHVDGPRSVAGAFSCSEIRDLAGHAGLENVQMTMHWPQRFLLRWDRP